MDKTYKIFIFFLKDNVNMLIFYGLYDIMERVLFYKLRV